MNSPILLPVPEVLDGARVKLRVFSERDAPQLLEAVEESREGLEAFLRWPARVHGLDDARDRIARLVAQRLLRDRLEWGIFEGSRLLGSVALTQPGWEARSFEVGYWLRRSAEGRGYMREALGVLTRYAFEELGARRVEVRVEDRNERSRRVPEALGYVLEGTLRNDHLGTDGQPVNMLVYALTSADYQK